MIAKLPLLTSPRPGFHPGTVLLRDDMTEIYTMMNDTEKPLIPNYSLVIKTKGHSMKLRGNKFKMNKIDIFTPQKSIH